MASLNQKIETFIEKHFPDIDYSILGANENSQSHKDALNYEYFVNSIEYFKLQKDINTEEIKQISTGDMRGIDGVLVVVNNQVFIIPEKDESEFFKEWENDIKSVIKKSSTLDVRFLFIQSKSSKTELDKFRGFCDAIYDVFSSEENDLSQNKKVLTVKDLFKEISKKEHKISLLVKLCAINKDTKTINRLLDLPEWSAAIEKQKKELKSTIFQSVTIEILSGQDYQEKLEAILAPNQRDYPIANLRDRFVEIDNEKATCYIGYLNLNEIKELIDDGNGELDDVFFDNIRYFQGFGDDDSVNSKIFKSLSDNSDIFQLLHNGITITAHSKHFNPENGNLEIKAFSIINGCQTSNIIWEWIKLNSPTVTQLQLIKIPVKIIISSDTKLRSKITETANTQNEVKTIQLISITDEAKQLQSLFDTEVRSGDKLYFERLANQFPDVGDSYKLQTTDIFRSFYSSFGMAPHKLTVGYGIFEKEMLKRKDFLGTTSTGKTKHDLKSYFISGLTFNYLERFIRSKHPYLLSLRHHLLLLLFITLDKEFISKAEDYKKKIPKSLMDSAIDLAKSKTTFNELAERICQIAINKFDFFIGEKNGKPKVKLKSYYTEEGTNKMIDSFVKEYYG
jgi:hypothetical protein